jgi:hypothetical protein
MTSYEFDDKRNLEQRHTHTAVIAGHDYFMSGWGHAKHRDSLAVWVCLPEHADKVEAWVRNRSEMHDVCRHQDVDLSAELVASWFPIIKTNFIGLPRSLHVAPCIAIYAVEEGHPALEGAE